MLPYMASTLRQVDPTLNYGMMLWISGTGKIAEGLFSGVLGGNSCKYFGYRKTMLIGGLIFR